MPNVNRREQLADELADLGVLAEASNPTGRKLEWNLMGRDDALATADDLSGLSTAEVEAFLAGLKLGRASAPGGRPRRMREPHPHRRAIIDEGGVEIGVSEDATPEDLKRLRNGLFAHGYALGLKGRFTVTLVGEGSDRRLVAEATQGADDEALVEARARLAAREDAA